jgi:opacity protein-like surface antigen
LLIPAALSFAQVAPAASGPSWTLQAGAEYSIFQPDWITSNIQGITAFADLDHIVLRNLGAEGEARWLRFHTSSGGGETEDNYLICPRYRLVRFHKLSGYAKFLMGAGLITYPNGIGSGSYFAYVPGGSAEYRFSRHWVARVDYEYQIWPSAPGIVFTFPNPSNGLSPHGISFGAAYKIF